MTLLLILHSSKSFWDDPVASHQEAGSFGEQVQQIIDEATALVDQRPAT